jgi:hypothetical protein
MMKKVLIMSDFTMIRDSFNPMRYLLRRIDHIHAYYSKYLPYIILVFSLFLLIPTISNAKNNEIQIDTLQAQHPKYCMAQGQWKAPFENHPFLMLDGRKDTAWIPCRYALQDKGYSIEVRFKNKIKINGIRVSQGIQSKKKNKRNKKGKRKGKKGKIANQNQSKNLEKSDFTPHQEIEKIQILFFNRSISNQYPVYYQNVLFDGDRQIYIQYDDILKWNPILMKDSRFDENRMAANFSANGMPSPIEIDGIGVVFWDMKTGEEPPALSEVELLLNRKVYRFSQLKDHIKAHVQWLNKLYQKTMKDQVWVGNGRSILFAQSGSIWQLKEEEDIPSIIGAWKSDAGRIMVDIHKKHHLRNIARKRAIINRRRARFYKPFAMMIDEVPDRLLIEHDEIGGEYEVMPLSKPTQPLQLDQDEYPPSFETP